MSQVLVAIKRFGLVSVFGTSFASVAYVALHYFIAASDARVYIKELQARHARLQEESQSLRQRVAGIDAVLASIRQENAKIKGAAQAQVAGMMDRVGIDASRAWEEAKLTEREAQQASDHFVDMAPRTASFVETIVRTVQVGGAASETMSDMKKTAAMVESSQAFVGAMPALLPTKGWLSSGFGKRLSPFHSGESVHKGVDLAADIGTPIYAPADGVVRYSGKFGRFGNYVSIVHGQGFVTKYAHASELFVKKGERVSKGQKIATVGASGRTTGSHLHYEVWYKEQPLDPEKFFPKEQLATAPYPVSFLAEHSASDALGTVAMGGDGDWQDQEPGLVEQGRGDKMSMAVLNDVGPISHPFGAMLLSFVALLLAVGLASGAPLPQAWVLRR